MGWFNKIVGKTAAEPIEAIGNLLDAVTTTDKERLEAQAILEKIKQKPHLVQAEITKMEAQHRSLLVAGWRPYIGWVAGICLSFYFIPQYILASYLWAHTVLENNEMIPYPVNGDGLIELVFALLGLGVCRTAEKLKKVAK